MQEIIELADELYKNYETEKLYNHLLPHKDLADDEIQWRLARVTHDKAKHEKDKQRRHNWMLEAFSYAKKALQMNPDSPHNHRWYGALLYFTTEGVGVKHKIQAAYEVREHFDKALSFDPEDVISLHSVGYWCFTFAERPWYQRKIASALFMALPETTYDEALEWFLKAEKIHLVFITDSLSMLRNFVFNVLGGMVGVIKQNKDVQENFMCTNLLMIGKSYLRLHNKEKAVEYFKKAADYIVKTPDDEQSQKEAVELLKHMGHGHLLKSCLH